MIFIEGCKNYVKSLDIDRENIIKNSKISSLDVKTQVSALLSKKKTCFNNISLGGVQPLIVL